MKYFLVLFLGGILLLSTSCDRVENPYPLTVQTDLDTTLYPGNWGDYVANEWPVFTPNTNLFRNVLIEDFTGHQCVFCPAAADLAHALHESNPSRVLLLQFIPALREWEIFK